MMPTATRPLDDDALAGALRDLAGEIDWPAETTTPDLAVRVRLAITARPAGTRPSGRSNGARLGWGRLGWGRLSRRALVLALIVLLAVAAVAGAMALGLPGLRLILAAADATPPPTVAPSQTAGAGTLGSGLGLGSPTDLAAAATAVGRSILLPTDPVLGPPDAVYVDSAKADAVALVWAASDALPASLEPGVGLVLMAFDGTLDDGYYRKLIGGGNTVTTATIGGDPGYWISGDPHLFFFDDSAGSFVSDERRWIGDALVWSDGEITYRLETTLGREAAIRIAESLE